MGGFYMESNFIQKMIAQSTIVLNANGYNSHNKGNKFLIDSDDFDILYTIDGSFVFTINDVVYTSEPNDIIIVPPNVKLHGEAITPCYHQFCHFSIFDCRRRKISMDFQDYRLPHSYSALYELVRQYYDKYHYNSNFGELFIMIIKLVLIEMILSSGGNEYLFIKTNNFDIPDNLQYLTEYINQHFKEQLNVAHLSRMVNSNCESLTKIFSRYLNTTPAKYVDKARMEYAMKRLTQTTITINELSNELHYCDQFAFSKAFKRYTGFSPSKYRELFMVAI